ncbi:hypothetical protein DFH09DRAFT_36083 [Mycena vulgaris]|nr:hypothetical protein DFH09DRAFT_36083 [Mycena vulgaris]
MPNSGAETPRLVGMKETLIDTTRGAVHLAAVALSVAGSATQRVPYLGAISTVLTEVLKIIDEVDACKSAWKNVGSKIKKIQTVVDDFRSQCVGEGMTDEELPDMIKNAFKDFEVCLLKVITTMNDCKPDSKRFVDRARLIYKRSELKAAAKQCGNNVDSALSIFQAKLQIDLFKTIHDLRNDVGDLRSAVSPHANLIANLNSISASFLPPSPSIFYGRSVEVDHVVNLVLNHAPARVAIVGSGGIGKTSIALTSIHHPEVEKYFLNQRFFLSCEAVITAESLTLDLLKLFGLSVDSSGSRSPSDILVSFAQSMTLKCLLCLDNFETPWDSDKDHVELLLAKIAVPHLTLIITGRDSDRPRGIKWTAPLLPPIQPLTVSAALETWDTISHGHDDFSLLLINAVDCIPLAVTLLAQLAESESAEALWGSWEIESTKLVKSDGSAHRLNNLELSIELSLQGPRLRACPGALDFFMILCMLPQGLPESRIPEFETSSKDYFGGIRSAIRVLKQCSLAYALEGFLRVLSPVRQYTQDHPDLATTFSTTLFTQMAELYFDLIPTDDLFTTSSVVRENIQLEIGNITAVLDVCLTKYANVPRVVHKVLDFSDACRHLYVYDTRLLSKTASVAQAHGLKSQEAGCYRKKGQIHVYIGELPDAEKMLKTALDLHTEANDKLGEADDLQSLGELYKRLDRLEEAERALQSALDLHTESNDKLGQANDLQSLGALYTRLDRLEKAERALQSALDLHTEINDKLGQANDLQSLGELYTRLDRLEEAERALQSALDLHTEINAKLSQANDLQSLGVLYTRLDRLEKAERALQSALDLHTEINDKLGQAYDLRSLGQLYTRLNRLEEAEQVLQSALDLHTEVNDKLGQAYDLRSLGELYTRLDRPDEAEEALQSALDLYTELNNRLGQANNFQSLGTLYCGLNRLEEAEEALQSALALHTEMNTRLGQANDLQSLGQLYTRLNRVEEAEEALQSALDLHTEINVKLSQATDLLMLGELYTRLDRPDEAEQALQSALDLYTELNNRHGQANDFQSLATLYCRLNRLEEAERALQSALNLHTEANDKLGQAYDLQSLGQLYTRLNRVEEAEEALQSALDLHTEINVKLSQATDLLMLGELYTRLDRPDEAEQALQSALDLYTELNNRHGQANDFQSLATLYCRLNRLEEAERALQSALNLHTEANDKLGQAYDLQSLGELYLRLDRFEEAERALHSALDLHTEVNDKHGQANDLQSLGKLYTKLNRLEEAERALISALNVYMEVRDSLGQGNSLGELGNLYITQCRFTEAQDFLTRAMVEYGHAHYSDGQQWVKELFDLLREKQHQIIPEPHEPKISIDDTP